MSQSNGSGNSRSELFFMLVSAGLFAYFGFGTTWNHYSVVDGRFLLFVALLDWTLKATAVGCGVAFVLTLIKPALGNGVYAVVGLLSAVMLAVVGVMDMADTQHTAMEPILLFIFAAWNGYGSWLSLRDLMQSRAVAEPVQFNPPAR